MEMNEDCESNQSESTLWLLERCTHIRLRLLELAMLFMAVVAIAAKIMDSSKEEGVEVVALFPMIPESLLENDYFWYWMLALPGAFCTIGESILLYSAHYYPLKDS